MINFELSEEIEKDVFSLVTSAGQIKKSLVPMRNRNLRPLNYGPQFYRYYGVQGHYKVQI